MRFQEFNKSLDQNLPRIFLLGGEERYFIDRAKSKIIDKIFPDKSQIEVGLTRVDDMIPSELIVAAQTVPFFSDLSLFYFFVTLYYTTCCALFASPFSSGFHLKKQFENGEFAVPEM